MDYEDRLTCFIDVLGFKDATHQSVKNFEVRKQIYDVIHSLKAEKVSTFVYDSLPLAQPNADGTVTHTTLKSLDNQELKENITKELNLTITQFSDSFVLSCPSNDDVSCNLLLKAVYLINIMFFSNLGMVMRGAITKGKLIHEEKGALFGPSMVEAYELESKSSIYPRIIITSDANELIYSNHTLLNQQGILSPIKNSFDGYIVIDLISIFSWDECNLTDKNQIETQLNAMKEDISKKAPVAYPKISYLLDQWKSLK